MVGYKDKTKQAQEKKTKPGSDVFNATTPYAVISLVLTCIAPQTPIKKKMQWAGLFCFHRPLEL